MSAITTLAVVHTTDLARMRAFVEAMGFVPADASDDRVYASPFTPGSGLLLKEEAAMPYAGVGPSGWVYLEFHVPGERIWAALNGLEAAGFETSYMEHPRAHEGEAVDPHGRTWHFLHYF